MGLPGPRWSWKTGMRAGKARVRVSLVQPGEDALPEAVSERSCASSWVSGRLKLVANEFFWSEAAVTMKIVARWACGCGKNRA